MIQIKAKMSRMAVKRSKLRNRVPVETNTTGWVNKFLILTFKNLLKGHNKTSCQWKRSPSQVKGRRSLSSAKDLLRS